MVGPHTLHLVSGPGRVKKSPSATILSMAEDAKARIDQTNDAALGKKLDFEKFITAWPLYTPFDCPNGYIAPARISFHCDGACRKETTWVRVDNLNVAYTSSGAPCGFYWVYYTCSLCTHQHLTIMYRDFATEMRVDKSWSVPTGLLRSGPPPALPRIPVVTQVQKIGQFPALSIDIPKQLDKNLGEEAAGLYKKALVSRNQNYGLGAVTYMRRVVEDKTDELIEVVAQTAESHGVEASVVEKIRAASSGRATYEEKLKLASTVLPSSLTPDGANPLGVLYGLVSQGVHELSEKDCIKVADEIRSVFEFTFVHLRADSVERQTFVEKVKRLAGRGKGTQEKMVSS